MTFDPDPRKPPTHVIWAKHYRDGRFSHWFQVGHARDEHIFLYGNVIGDNAYLCRLPIGETPPLPPPPAAQRPAQARNEEE